MKTAIIAAALIVSGCACLKGSIVTDDYLNRVERVESGGRQIVGDGGAALGSFQMHHAAWDQVSKQTGWTWEWRTGAFHRSVAKNYARAYLQWLERSLERRLGRPPTEAELYAAWNIGLGGFAKRGYSLAFCPAITQRAVKKLQVVAG